MKHRFFVLLFCLPIVGLGQFQKGMRMAGASIGSVVYNSGEADITVSQIGSNISHVKNYNISITPSMGWFINDGTAIGITININPQGNTTNYEQNGSTYQEDKSNSFNIGLGGFLRNYFNSSGNLKPFGQVAVNGGFSNLKTEGFFYGGVAPLAYKDSYTGNSNGGVFVNANLQAGLTKLISALTGLDLYIGYNFSYNKHTFKRTTLRDFGNNGSVDERYENETTTKFTNHGFMIGAGFQVFLERNKK